MQWLGLDSDHNFLSGVPKFWILISVLTQLLNLPLPVGRNNVTSLSYNIKAPVR